MAQPLPPSMMKWLQDAAARHQAGDLSAAERLYDKVLKADPNNPDALNLKGVVASDTGRHKHAISFFDRAAKALPGFADPHFNKALALVALGRTGEAFDAYADAIRVRPSYGDARLNLGLLLHTMGRKEEAIATFRAMTEQCPNDVRGFYNLGACLEKSLPGIPASDRDAIAAESAAAFECAFALDPRSPDVLYAYSNLHNFRGQYREAAVLLEKALRLRPQWPDAWNNLANQVEALGDREGALALFERALEQNPDNAGAFVNRGMACLVLGRLAEGWEGYARRFEDPRFPFVLRRWSWPKWNGEDLRGKSILLWGDQGVGDEVLYSSMIPQIAARAGTCVVECAPRLLSLYQRSFPDLEIVSDRVKGQSSLTGRSFDYHCSVLDLGAQLRRSFAAFPNGAGVLRADQAWAARLRQKYLRDGSENRVVGLSWRSTNPGMAHQKSLTLPECLPVLRMPGLTFVNLQYGNVTQDIAEIRAQGIDIIEDPDVDPLTDLDAFAAQVLACDRIMTVSNTTAHFAGALDVPTALYVPQGRKHLWYWFADGHYSPWYRNVRVFRSPAPAGLSEIATAFGSDSGP